MHAGMAYRTLTGVGSVWIGGMVERRARSYRRPTYRLCEPGVIITVPAPGGALPASAACMRRLRTAHSRVAAQFGSAGWWSGARAAIADQAIGCVNPASSLRCRPPAAHCRRARHACGDGVPQPHGWRLSLDWLRWWSGARAAIADQPIGCVNPASSLRCGPPAARCRRARHACGDCVPHPHGWRLSLDRRDGGVAS